MKSSELVKAMSDAGAPMEAILIALQAIEEGQDAIEQRRAAERERKRRQRSKAKDADGTVTGQSQDADGTVTDEPSLSPSPLPSPQTPQPTPRPHTHPDKQTRARKADNFPRPDWADPQVWSDLKRNRRTKRLTNTETAHKQFLADIQAMADDHWPPGRLLEAIVAKGWGGAHDPRPDRKPANDRQQSKPSGTATAAERARANLGCH